MRIPIANEIQEKINNGDALVFIDWFEWSLSGLRFTYHMNTAPSFIWSHMYPLERTEFSEEEYERGYIIDDRFLKLASFKDFGIPLKGKGYVDGLDFREDGVYYDFIYESQYLAHVQVKMTPEGKFDGKIIVPPTWDTDKRKKILLSSAKDVEVVCANILER